MKAPRRSLLFRYLGLAASRFAGSAGNFLLLALVGRSFGAETTGMFFATVSTGFIVAVLFNFGLSRFTLRHLSHGTQVVFHDSIKLIGVMIWGG